MVTSVSKRSSHFSSKIAETVNEAAPPSQVRANGPSRMCVRSNGSTNTTLIECRFETGRTHQIRIHLSEAGHPIYGDAKYGNADAEKASPANTIPSSLRALILHAATLGFRHPTTGEQLRFQSEPPADFLSVVDRLRKPAAGF